MPTSPAARRCLFALAALLLVGCSDDEPESLGDSSFCDDIRERRDAFVAEGENEIPPTLVGALREVVDDGEAPDELRDAYNQLTEASGDDELDEAVTQIKETLAECGVDMDP